MPTSDAERLVTKGIEALDQGNTLSALFYFERAKKLQDNPVTSSYFAFCIAKERGQISKAIELCKEAMDKEPGNTVHYLNLGRIYLLAMRRKEAITIFKEGLNHGANQQILDELNRLGMRKTPVIPFLGRSSPINKYLGIILTKMRLR